jgi:hypothetical protein
MTKFQAQLVKKNGENYKIGEIFQFWMRCRNLAMSKSNMEEPHGF